MSAADGNERCGEVALIGRPNVGKSTLLNCLLGQKVSITSSRPQTTRHLLRGIHTEGLDQILFVDTPGLHSDGKRTLNRVMNRAARSILADVDLVCMLVEALRWTEEDSRILELLAGCRGRRFLVISKTDRARPRERLLPYMAACAQRADFDEIVPLSALKGENVQTLLACICGVLPEGPHVFAEDQFTDRSERFLVAEIVREKLLRQLGDELPHQLAVMVDRWVREKEILVIHLLILVERPGQRPIIVGSRGQRLKEVGISARREAEALLGVRIRLDLWVKVRSGWSDDDQTLRQLGLKESG